MLIENGILVTPHGLQKANMRISDGKIEQTGAELSPQKNEETLDAAGCYVFPGFIDAHTHLDMNNGVTTTADDFASGTRAAVAGGTTTIVDFCTQEKGGTLQQAIDCWHGKADGKCSCNYAFHLAVCDWNEAVKQELQQAVQQGITSFKVYLAYDALRVDDAQLLDILSTVKALGGVLGVHCENGTLVNYLCEKQKQTGNFSPAAHPKSRPPQVEAEAIARLLHIAKLADAAVHIVHLSSAAGLDEIRCARERGQTVYVETCPQYLLLDDSLYLKDGFEGAKYVISPPLRSKEDVLTLQEAVCSGEIDTIATDHCSYNFNTQKKLGEADFTKIPNGAPGIEHRPQLIFTQLVSTGRITPQKMCSLLSTNPAKLFGMYPQKGSLQVGSDADIVIWNPEKTHTISAKTQFQNVDYTPFEGFAVKGGAETVLINGKTAVKNSMPCNTFYGEFIKRSTVKHPILFTEET